MATARAWPVSQRDELRAEVLSRLPRWYNPWVHLAFPSLVGIVAIVVSLSCVRDPGPLDLLFVVALLALTNANEWRIHRDLLHRRSWPLRVLYDRHTPEHHMIFVEEDMAMRTRREFTLVLIPAYGILAIFLTTLPITIALALFVSRNLAALWVATEMAYVVSYEWLHLSYHAPADSFVGQLAIVRWLRRHHATHHRPELMQRWNFNVTVPFWDWVMGTTYRGG